MRTRSTLPIVCAVALATFAAAGPCAAQSSAADRESARSAFAEGNQLRDSGKVREALEKYKAAFALAPTPVTALEVGRAEADLGQLVEAREVLLDVEHIAEAGQESAKSKAARKEAAALAARIAPRIPRLTIRIVGGGGAQTEGLMVNVDGNTVPTAALAVARSVNPGRHAVMAIVAGHTVQQGVELREGDTRDVVLDIGSIATASGGGGAGEGGSAAGEGGLGLNVGTSPTASGAGAGAGGGGMVAFNQPDDGHAWSLRSPRGQELCKLPCAQSLGFSNGYVVVRDDGERVSVPGGLAALPNSTAQVEPRASAGSRTTGWILVTVGAVAMVAGLVVMVVGADSVTATGSFNETGLIAGAVIAGAGALVLTVGWYVAALSHGPMLIRTDTGMPVRVSHAPQPVVHVQLSPTGVVGTF